MVATLRARHFQRPVLAQSRMRRLNGLAGSVDA